MNDMRTYKHLSKFAIMRIIGENLAADDFLSVSEALLREEALAAQEETRAAMVAREARIAFLCDETEPSMEDLAMRAKIRNRQRWGETIHRT